MKNSRLPRDPFAALWVALAVKLAGPDPFLWGPQPLTLRERADRGEVITVGSLFAGGDVTCCPADPTWSDPDAEDDGEEGCASIFAIWPELRPHLPHDGKLRAVATVSAPGEAPDRHQVREIDLDTGALGPALSVVTFAPDAGDAPEWSRRA